MPFYRNSKKYHKKSIPKFHFQFTSAKLLLLKCNGLNVRVYTFQELESRYCFFSVRHVMMFGKEGIILFKDTHREKALSNKTPTLLKSMNVDTWVAGTLNQLFVRSS